MTMGVIDGYTFRATGYRLPDKWRADRGAHRMACIQARKPRAFTTGATRTSAPGKSRGAGFEKTIFYSG